MHGGNPAFRRCSVFPLEFYNLALCFDATMRIKLILNGKTEEAYVEQGCAIYEARIHRYIPFSKIVVPTPKVPAAALPGKIREVEALQLEKHLAPDDYVVLLDEKGRSYTSEGFSVYLQQKMNSGLRNLVFIVGGPYGFHTSVYARANDQISLSPLTFPHQLVRLIFAEQLYRALSILRNEPYHHA